MSVITEAARTLVWLLPACRPKNRLLTALGHPVHPTAIARSNLVRRVGVVSLGPGSRIARWNLIKNMRAVRLGADATIGRYNVITAHPVFTRLLPGGGSLTLDVHSYVTSRHSLDCSGSVSVGPFASLAGHGSTVLTHSIDLRRDAQTALPVVIGERSFIGTNCILLGGAVFPPRSVLGAGSLLTRSKTEREPGLWAGVPATRRGDADGAWFNRKVTGTRRVYVPTTDETVEDAF